MKARLVDINGNLLIEDELKGVDVYPDIIRWRHRSFTLRRSSLMRLNQEYCVYEEAKVYWITHG